MFGLPPKISHLDAYYHGFDQVVYLGDHAFYVYEEDDGSVNLYPRKPVSAFILMFGQLVDYCVNPFLTAFNFDPITIKLVYAYSIREYLEEKIEHIQKIIQLKEGV